MFMKAAEGGSRQRFLRHHKRRAKLTSTSIAKHPKTIPAIAGPDNLALKDGLDESAVWALASVSEAPSTVIDLGNVSWPVIVLEEVRTLSFPDTSRCARSRIRKVCFPISRPV